MERKVFGFFTILVILSACLFSCSSPSTPIETTPETNTDLITPTALDIQPTEPPLSAAEILEDELDEAFQTLLDDMVSYNAINSDALMMLLDEEPPPFVLDVRSLSEIAETGRIEGSVVIPFRDLAREESITLLPSFDTRIVTYCGTGWRCAIALPILGALGWHDVYTLGEGGLAEWINAGYPTIMDPPPNEALNVALPDPTMQAWMNELLDLLPSDFGMVTPEILNRAISEFPDLTLIDVRRTEEIVEEGAIENAIHIPLESFILMKEEWPLSTTAKILVYSNTGYRSTIAMSMLWTYGYVGVASLKGGFNAWVDEGYTVAEIAVSE